MCHFAGCFVLGLRRARRRLLLLLCMALAALLLCLAAGAAVAGLYAGRNFSGITLAVAVHEEDEALYDALGLFGGALAQLLGGSEGRQNFAGIIRTQPGEAAQLVQTGQATAAVVLPQGFMNSVYSGENLSPRLIVDASRPLEMAMVLKLAESSARMLAAVQQGIAFTLEVYDVSGAAQPSKAQLTRDINLEYASWVFSRDLMFRGQVVSPAGALTVLQQTLLCAIAFFTLLCGPVLHGLFSLKRQQGWLLRLRAGACPLPAFAAAQVACGALALVGVLALLLVGAGLWVPGAGFSAMVLPGLLGCGLFLAALLYLLCNAGGILPASVLVFVLALAGLVTSGGTIPLVLLPRPLAALAPFSPIAWVRDALAPAFGAPASPAALLALWGGGLVLLGLCLLHARLFERRAAA